MWNVVSAPFKRPDYYIPKVWYTPSPGISRGSAAQINKSTSKVNTTSNDYSEKYCDHRGFTYNGKMDKTVTDATCASWSGVQTPYTPTHNNAPETTRTYDSETNRTKSTGTAHNYCRLFRDAQKIPTKSETGGKWVFDKDINGRMGDTGYKHPWCYVGAFNNGAQPAGTGGTVFKENLAKYNTAADGDTSHSWEFNVNTELDDKNNMNMSNVLFANAWTNGKHENHWQTYAVAQRCNIGTPNYSKWDCMDVEEHGTYKTDNKSQSGWVTKLTSDEHKIQPHSRHITGTYSDRGAKPEGYLHTYKKPTLDDSLTNFKSQYGSKESIKLVRASGFYSGKLTLVNDLSETGVFGWLASNEQIAFPTKEPTNRNFQEHWIEIRLPIRIILASIELVDATINPRITSSALPVKVLTYASLPTKTTDPQLKQDDLVLDYNATKDDDIREHYIDYPEPSYHKTVLEELDESKTVKVEINKPCQSIVLKFVRPYSLKNIKANGLKKIILTRVYQNYELNYQKASKSFRLFDYSNTFNEIIENNKVNVTPIGKSFALYFEKSNYFKIERPIEIMNIAMISCWIKLPLDDTNMAHTLIGDESGKNSPVYVDKDQNKLGILSNGVFIDSHIRLGELKKKWHHLMVFFDKTKCVFYINGLNRSNERTYESGATNVGFASTDMNSVYTIGNSSLSNTPWGGMVSNINIFGNWGYRYNMSDSDKSDLSTDNVVPTITGTNTNTTMILRGIERYVGVKYGTVASDASLNWKSRSCPNHKTTIKKAVNTAVATAVTANKHRFDKVRKQHDKDIQNTVQEAENEAYKSILDHISNNSNLIIWNNVNTDAKKIKLEVDKLGSELGISHIQIYGTGNGETKDWVQDCEVFMSSQQLEKDGIVDIVKQTTLTSEVSNIDDKNSKCIIPNRDDTTKNYGCVSIACPTGYHITGCKCLSTDTSCNGSRIHDNKCYAFNKEGGSGVKAHVRCTKFKNLETDTTSSNYKNDYKIVANESNPQEVDCADVTNPNLNNQFYMIGCHCDSTDNSCDGSEIVQIDETDKRKRKCVAHNTNAGSAVNAQGICINMKGSPEMPNVSQQIITNKIKSSSDDNATNTVKCPTNSFLMDGDCKTDNYSGDCNGAILNKTNNSVTAYNREYGEGVYATANCMRFDVIDDNCRDGNLDTVCVTSSSENSKPYITFTLPHLVFIKKIVIYNRKKDKIKNLPFHIHLIDKLDNIILTGIKNDYNKPLELINIPPEPPLICSKGYKDLNITDVGDSNYPRAWVDIRGVGENCDYCRFTGSDKSKMLSCALGDNQFEQYNINSTPDIDTKLGIENTRRNKISNLEKQDILKSSYFFDESGNDKADFCYIKKGESQITCLENNGKSFSNEFKPNDQVGNYANLTGDEIINLRKPFDTSKCNTNQFSSNFNKYKIDAGFYWPCANKYILFKNSKLDTSDVVIFTEIDLTKTDDFIDNNIFPLIVNNKNWTGIMFTNIDATLYLDSYNDETGDFVYFFYQNQCQLYDLQSNKAILMTNNQTISDISEEFPNLPFIENLDSTCYLGDNECYFFKENKYCSYNIKSQTASTVSHISSSGTFKTIPFTTGIDGIICFYKSLEKWTILFKDDKYVKISQTTGKDCSLINHSINPSKYITDFYGYKLWDININTAFTSIRNLKCESTNPSFDINTRLNCSST